MMDILRDFLSPPFLMAASALAFMWLVAVPDPPIPRWKYWLAVVILMAGMGNFFIRVAYGLWKMHA